MTTDNFVVEFKPPFRDVLGRFAKANKKLIKDKRDMIRNQMRLFVRLAQDEAPKKSGEFADNIRFRTFERGEIIEGRITAPQPLSKWIQKGTKAHPIVAKNTQFLRFFWAKGPEGPGIYYFRSVWHPGTKPNPFMDRAYSRWITGARKDLNKIARDWGKRATGKKQ